MTRSATALLAGLFCLAAATQGAAQERDVRSELARRAAPPDFVAAVAAEVDRTRAEGLPPGPVADKALEGWAKRVTAQRVVTALIQVRARLAEGRAAVADAGMAAPPAGVVTGAAEALRRGLSPEDIRALVTRAPSGDEAGAGLAVAASLRAQGLDRQAAVRAVLDAYGQGAAAAQLYELPSAVADLTGRGIAMADVARRIMEGGGLPLPPMAGAGQSGGRPGNLPPGPGGQQGTGRRGRQ